MSYAIRQGRPKPASSEVSRRVASSKGAQWFAGALALVLFVSMLVYAASAGDVSLGVILLSALGCGSAVTFLTAVRVVASIPDRFPWVSGTEKEQRLAEQFVALTESRDSAERQTVAQELAHCVMQSGR